MRLVHLVKFVIRTKSYKKSLKGFFFTVLIMALGCPFVLPPITLAYYWSKSCKPVLFPLTDVTNTPRVQVCTNGDNQGTSPKIVLGKERGMEMMRNQNIPSVEDQLAIILIRQTVTHVLCGNNLGQTLICVSFTPRDTCGMLVIMPVQ